MIVLNDIPFAELHDQLRRQIRGNLIAQSIPPEHVDEITDIGLHAASEARETLVRTLHRGSTSEVQTTALGIALGVAIAELGFLQETMISAANATGLPVRNFAVAGGGQ